MELEKNEVRISENKGIFSNQLTLEQDVNVSDSKPDAASIVLKKGCVRLENVAAQDNQIAMSGTLQVTCMYQVDKGMSEEKQPRFEELTASIGFNEKISAPGVDSGDLIIPNAILDDIQVKILNSRKLQVRAAIELAASVSRIEEISVAESIDDPDDGVDYLSECKDICRLVARKKDSLYVRDDVELGQNKPNISKILYKELNANDVCYKLMDGCIEVSGDILLFAIYQGEEEGAILQWMEKSIPFTVNVDCPQCKQGQIADIHIIPKNDEITVKPDDDGENRCIALELTQDIYIQLFEEEKVGVLVDAYSACEEMELTKENVNWPVLVGKNDAKCRINERISLPEDAGCMQICYSQGDVKIDRVWTQKDLNIEGVIDVSLIYMSSDDATPIKYCHESIPFSHELSVPGADETCDISVTVWPSQTSAVMISGNEVEARALLEIDALVTKNNQQSIITRIDTKPFDKKKMEDIPAIAGYIVKPEDTLWSIAKNMYTTIDQIKRINNLTTDTLNPGDKLLIVKEGLF